MPAENAKTFSIRTLLFATFVLGVLLAGLRSPSDATVLCVAVTLIASVTLAWVAILRDCPEGHQWTLAFAIAAPLFAMDIYLVPNDWSNSAFAFVQPEAAAEHARSTATGLNKQAVAFTEIVDDGAALLLAVCTAAVVCLLRPSRISLFLVFGWVAVTSAALLLVHHWAAFAVSVGNIVLLTLVWYVIVCHSRTTDRFLGTVP